MWLAALAACVGGCTFEVRALSIPPPDDGGAMAGVDLAAPSQGPELGGGGEVDLSIEVPPDLSSSAAIDLSPRPSDLRGCTVVDQNFATAPGAGWFLGGDAIFDAAAQRVRLTAAAPNEAGSLFWTTPVAVTSMHARFRVLIGGGNGADGMALALTQTSDPTTGLLPTVGGVGLGYRGMTGVAVELDTYRNGSEPNVEHVGFMRASDGAHIVYAAPPVMLDCNCVRTIDVWLKPGRVRVRVDDQPTLDETIAPGDFTAGTYYLGFTASTGGRNNQHAVLDALFVAGPEGCE
jgi:hypothetical protein